MRESNERNDRPLLEVEGLTKKFRGLTAVDEVDLSVGSSEIQSVIGPNGAGKTTLFNLLTGTYEATAGRIVFDGEDITDRPDYRRPHIGISRSYQISNIYGSMTVFENLETAVALYERNYLNVLEPLGRDGEIARTVDELVQSLDLSEQRDVEGTSLSHGDRRRLEIGMALASDPELLLLDEPTAGMDAAETQRTMEFIETLAEDMAILLVEHDIEHIMQVSTNITVLERGSVIADGPPETIRSNAAVQEAYLGDTSNA
jgi:branched-chain amino acid transport system ATP-binding protein